MAYHQYPDSYAFYAPPPGWMPPGTTAPAGGDSQIKFGTFPGLTPEMQAPPGYGHGGAYPAMYPMAPGPFPYPQHPPHMHQVPPPQNRAPSRNKNRDEKRTSEGHRPPAQQSDPKRGPGRGGENGGHGGSSQGYHPSRMPPPAQHMHFPPYGMPYPMYPAYAPHPAMQHHHPNWEQGRYRLPLEPQQHIQPPTSNPAQHRNMHQDVEAQSPKSATSTTSRNRKQLSLVHPKTGKQLEHDEVRPQPQPPSSHTQKHAARQQTAHKDLHLEKAQVGVQNGSGKEMTRKHEEKVSNRPMPVTTSQVVVVSTSKPLPVEEARKEESPRKRKGLQLQAPGHSTGPVEPADHRQNPHAVDLETKDVQGTSAKKDFHPSEGHALVQSTVVQVPVAQTQLPQKKNSPLKISPRTLENKIESKDSVPDTRVRAPESKIPSAPSGKVAMMMAQKIAAAQDNTEKQDAGASVVNEDKAPDAPEIQPKILSDEESKQEEAVVDVDKQVIEDQSNMPQVKAPPSVSEERAESPDAESSTGTGRAKSPETVIVNEGEDDSQDEEEKPPEEKASSPVTTWVEKEEAKSAVEPEASWKEGEQESSKKQEPPARQDSLGRKASGSLRSIPSRAASLEKQTSGWRLQRENSRRNVRNRGDDCEVFHKSSGNRLYSTEFLLALRDKFTEKPQGIVDNSVWRDSLTSIKSRSSTERARWTAKPSFEDKDGRGQSRVGAAWRDPGRTLSTRSSASRGSARRDMDDKWTRMASPFAGAGSGLHGLHQAEKKYVVGELTSDDPDEEARQKKYKAVLNKLTPENFDRMFEQIKQVEVKEHKTLEGLIYQIFDKALTETTFCPLYASLCKRLMGDMPEFEVEGDKRKVTFRRLLLNKCQNEFEKGDAALRAADEVEKRGLDSPEELEKLRVAKKERMRSLGNMQFIGHLFKEEMLTEKIIHQCIVDLLREQENPKFEDIECLCQLVSTVGRQLKDCKEIGAYFGRIQRLTENPKLDTRHQFMLIDLIELRDRNWVARRKAEGPKKIDEIRQDAREEQMSRDPQRGGNWGGLSSRSSRDRGGGGWPTRSNVLPQRTGLAHPNPTYDRSVIEPLSRGSSINRTNSEDISLRPGSISRPAYSRSSSQRQEGRMGDPAGQDTSKPVNHARVPSPTRSHSIRDKPQPKSIPEEPQMDPEVLKGKVKGFLRDFYQVADLKEVQTCISDLSTAGAIKEDIVATAIRTALDLRDVPVDQRLVPLCGLMCDLLRAEALRPIHLRKGVEDALACLPEIAEDFPKAPELLADMMEDLSQRENIPMTTILKMIKGAGKDQTSPGTDTALVESGYASKVFLRILKKRLESGNPLPVNIKDQLIELDVLSLYPGYERESINISEILSFLDGNTNS